MSAASVARRPAPGRGPARPPSPPEPPPRLENGEAPPPGGGRAGPELDRRVHGFAPFGIVHPEHDALAHRGVPAEHRLDVRWIDVEPAGDDHVAHATPEIEVAALLQHAP